jgi:hypothetical protein
MRIKYGSYIVNGKDKTGMIEDVTDEMGRRLVNIDVAVEVNESPIISQEIIDEDPPKGKRKRDK